MKAYTEIEGIIENRIAALSEDYELDRWDIKDIRLKAYRENGWYYDPFPEEEEEEDRPEEEIHYRSMYDQLREVGMSMRDFF